MCRRILYLLILLILFGQADAAEKRFDIPLEGSPSLGPEDAPVVMVEFLDYQ